MTVAVQLPLNPCAVSKEMVAIPADFAENAICVPPKPVTSMTDGELLFAEIKKSSDDSIPNLTFCVEVTP